MDGKRILLIDDTLTTGAMAQSAASALSNRGATVVGILTIGRMIKPSFSETVNEDWQRQRGPVDRSRLIDVAWNSRDEPRNGDHA